MRIATVWGVCEGGAEKGEKEMLYATVRQRKIYVKNPTTVIQNGVGVDQIVLDMDDEWKDMTSIVCVFQNGETKKEKLHVFGQLLEVPWECLTETGRLTLSCTGYVGSEKVMTTMLPDSFWNVVQNGPVTGSVPLDPTPTLYEQILAAANYANEAAQQLLEDKANGMFDGRDGVDGKDGKDGADGKDGYTPRKNIDYVDGKDGKDGRDYVLTDADKAEIAQQAAQLVDVPTDEHINSLINSALGVIENGTY